MTGIFIVAIMLVAAVAIDASRIFVAKNELQTAADAAALAGARQLLDDSSTALDTARAYAYRNRVEADSIQSVEMELGIWLPAEQPALRFVPSGEPWDAVRVTTRHPLRLSLTRALGDSTVSVSATAIAWSSGPVMEPQCVKPLAVPYSRLLDILNYPATSNVELNDDDIRRLREMPDSLRRWHFHYGNQGNEDYHGADDDYGVDHFKRDQYFPIDIDSAWVRNDASTYLRPSLGPEDYQSYLAGPPIGRCSQRVRSGDALRSEPQPKIDAMRNGLSDICESLGGTFVLSSRTFTCRSGGETLGLPLRVVYWSGPLPLSEAPTWYNSGLAAELTTRMTGSFVVESLDWNDGDGDGQSREHARMWGHFDVQEAFGVVDETVSSMLLRPVLVK
jgi:hypothetical protein